MSRFLTVGDVPSRGKNPGPTSWRAMTALLHQAKDRGCDLVVFPELALTTFFPRWCV